MGEKNIVERGPVWSYTTKQSSGKEKKKKKTQEGTKEIIQANFPELKLKVPRLKSNS